MFRYASPTNWDYGLVGTTSLFLCMLELLPLASRSMRLSKHDLWLRFQKYYTEFPKLGLAVDLSRMNFTDEFIAAMQPKLQEAFEAMDELEKGAIANPDERRMVGHYWLRDASLAPTPKIRTEIEDTLVAVKAFAEEVHVGKLQGAHGKFENLLLIGIGGSALGPQFVSRALGHPLSDKMQVFVFDNTDPDGMEVILSRLAGQLGQTLCLVVSKSGGTPETRNGMLEAKGAYERNGLSFAVHATAITQQGSALDKYAVENKWLRRFPMWDWVGGRTSEFSAVGMLPAALQGLDVDSILDGARNCDQQTRVGDWRRNPAAQLSLMWYYAGEGRGSKDMVVLPYKDRLEYFSRYLQQLIMESLGKELDLNGNKVNQGIVVYGNKGSTDQHAYVQQLRDGQNNFFATFIEVRCDGDREPVLVDAAANSGDYLSGFLQGTRNALYEKDRESITITLDRVSPARIGSLIALFERAVGLYAGMININPYHQPGVEAGKKAASEILNLQERVLGCFAKNRATGLTITRVAKEIAAEDQVESVFKICEHLAANRSRGIQKQPNENPFQAIYRQA